MTSRSTSPGVWETFAQSPLSSKVILLGVMVNRLSGFLQIFIVLFLISLGYSHQQTIFALAVYGAGAVIGALMGGSISEHFGARTASMISMGATGILTAALLYLSNFIVILIVVALASLCAQLFRPASSALLSQQTPPERQTMIFAIYRLGLNLGATGAPLVGYALYQWGHESFTYLFWGEAIIAGLYALLAALTLPGKLATNSPENTGETSQIQGGYRQILADRRFILFLLATFCHSAVFVQYITTLPMYVEDKGIALFWYTLAVSLNGMIVICFELLITKVTQNYEKRKMLAFGFTLIGAGVAFYAVPIGPAALIVGTLIWSLGEIISGPAFFAFPANAGPSKLKAHYLGSFHFMFSLGIALGPVIGGWLYLAFDEGVWPIVALGSFFAAAICGYYAKENTTAEKTATNHTVIKTDETTK
ncbi:MULTISPECIES: MFS transporter [Photorhabdus]|uniref:MFS transporter n=1 Tax=Photorhabdus luminescens subsp. sonorensis TaxID=1173677 RepID=A0A5C4RFU2_PHOLU|nr:MFS transporter [Photorhabdus luminescens]TNH42950.1 MFS transporter [Photorhabdus luminescens subsp. sonorensis]